MMPAIARICIAGWILILSVFASQTESERGVAEAVRLHQAGKYGPAITAYRQFLKTHPDAAPVRSNLGAALAHEGRFAEAVREYTIALRADPHNQGVRFNLGLAYYKTGELHRALAAFEEVYRALSGADPQRRRAALLAAECNLRTGNAKRVIELLDPLATTDPADLATAYLLGTALIRDNQEQRGALIIQRILGAGDTAQAHMLMAFTRMKLSDKKAAMTEVARAIQLDPELAEAYNLQGRILFLNSDLNGAEQAFRKALALDSNLFESTLFLGALLRQQGSIPESRKLLARALQLRPDDMRARYQFAVLQSAEEKNDEAAGMLEKLVREAPDFEEAHRSLSTIYARLGRASDARREREIAEKLDAATQAHSQEMGRSLK